MNRFSLFTLLGLLLLSWTACVDNETFVGSDTFVTETRSVDAFSGVRISDGTIATITFGAEQDLALTVNDNIADRVLTEVRNGVLEVGLRNGNYRNIEVSVDIVIPNLDFLRVTDGADATATGFDALTDLRLEVHDGGDVTLAGTAETLDIVCSDAGDINAFDLMATRCEVRISDGADVSVSVSDLLTGRVSDGGDLFFRGQPELDVTTTDGGRITDAN
ncbi:DUF2807 domain-containing protein [Lewinella sp. W8]|uniref:GIN domain-containing protein n=1 Tax=Lewinella sp. W8 TaxID=2528208 RepID=UPI001067F321|nr:DUF2807 domain-containing protein [Lewinella sp. W8]MTB50560.1 hypothetical protein [Lewinella sp. W8]